eukprot:117569-Pyramimonas_sp.AAC.1
MEYCSETKKKETKYYNIINSNSNNNNNMGTTKHKQHVNTEMNTSRLHGPSCVATWAQTAR